MFKYRYNVTIVDETWNVLKIVSLITIPKQEEFIYFDIIGKYYKILQVVHQINKKHKVILVVKEFSN